MRANSHFLNIGHIEYSTVRADVHTTQDHVQLLTIESAQACLEQFRDNSAIGLDMLPTLILKKCAHHLAKPLQMLALRILADCRWPESWLWHWIAPIFKRKEVFFANNYRGVHLTSQLSKAMERLLMPSFAPFLSHNSCFGENQFAYQKERGARDAVAYLVLTWISVLNSRRKVGVYCSDVAGAFDRVDMLRLVEKLRATGLHPNIVSLLESWLRRRSASVKVGGASSEEIALFNIVFQGTVWGPILWNIFFQDAKYAIRKSGCAEIVYADDLNAFKDFPRATCNEDIVKDLQVCQTDLHEWGVANQVLFDASKEGMHVLSTDDPTNGSFRILGIEFDGKLSMHCAIAEMVQAVKWKVVMVTRSRRYYNDAELVCMYKAHILSFVEYRTAAIFHATQTELETVDRIQSSFLRDLGISERDVLLEFRLAPLGTRRDIAMLGIIHRAATGRGPPQLRTFFRPSQNRVSSRRHKFHLEGGLEGNFLEIARRSCLGLIRVYNALPREVVEDGCKVEIFQSRLQAIVIANAKDGAHRWDKVFSPRC